MSESTTLTATGALTGVRRPRGGTRWLAVLKTPVGACATLGVLALLVLAVIAPILWSEEANRPDVANMLQGPSAAHWAGTDNLGRDIFFRVLVATRLSVGLALTATAIAVVLGLLLGTIGVVLGRRAARLVSAVINVAIAFPGILLALFFAIIFGAGAKGAVLAIGFAGAPAFARLSQTLVSGIEQRDFVAAARIGGAGRARVLVRHVLPNIAEPLIVNTTISAGGALLAFASLSFLGLGVQPPSYDWGRLLGDGLTGIYEQPIAALAPGIAVILAGLAFNLFGEALAKGIGLTTTLGGVPLGKVKRATPEVPIAASEPTRDDALLEVEDMVVTFPARGAAISPVRGVSFAIGSGQAVGVVGESGSGKSLTALALARLIEEPGRVSASRLRFAGADLMSNTPRVHRQLLGKSLAMVFQDPMTSLNPTQRVGRQLAEVSREHSGLSRRAAFSRAIDRLRAVRIPAAERRAHQYPHEFSGGMRQRAMIGMGLMGTPRLIVADEPTTALDVTVQRRVLDLLETIRSSDDVALLLISHDVAVIRQVCERVLVMYAGRIVEDLPASELATAARHPYTRALVAAVPDMQTDLGRPLAVIPGRAPDPANLPPGCAFAPRCPLATEQCWIEDPPLVTDSAGRRVACWHAGDPLPDEAADSIVPVGRRHG